VFTKSTFFKSTFFKSTFLGIALIVTAIGSGTAPALAYLSLTPRTEAQDSVDANQASAASKTADVNTPDAVRRERSTEVANSTDVTEFADTGAADDAASGPALAAATANSL